MVYSLQSNKMEKPNKSINLKFKNYEKVSIFDAIANGYWFGIV